MCVCEESTTGVQLQVHSGHTWVCTREPPKEEQLHAWPTMAGAPVACGLAMLRTWLGQRVPTRESLKGNPTQYCISPYCCHRQLLYWTLPNASSDLCRYCCRMSFTCLFAQRLQAAISDSKLLEIAAVVQEIYLQQHATPSYNYITKM